MTSWDKILDKKPVSQAYKRKIEIAIKDSQTKQVFSFVIVGTPLQWSENAASLRQMAHEKLDCVLDRCEGIGVCDGDQNISVDAPH